MKVFVAVLALAAVANAGVVVSPLAATISRVPSLDSAVIQSDRIGGNFAYSVAESHAHSISQPIVQHVATPVAVSYSVPQVIATAPQVIAAAPQVAVARSVIAAPQLLSSGVAVAGLPAATALLK